jgi:hypothetical protein
MHILIPAKNSSISILFLLFLFLNILESAQVIPTPVIATYGNYKALNQKDSKTLWENAKKYFKQDQYDKALHCFAALHRHFPETQELNQAIIRCLIKLDAPLKVILHASDSGIALSTFLKENQTQQAMEFLQYSKYMNAFYSGASLPETENVWIRAESMLMQRKIRHLEVFLKTIMKNDPFHLKDYFEARLAADQRNWNKMDIYNVKIPEHSLLKITLDLLQNLLRYPEQICPYSSQQLIQVEQKFFYGIINPDAWSFEPADKPNPFWLFEFEKHMNSPESFPMEQWKSFVRNPAYQWIADKYLEHMPVSAGITEQLREYFNALWNPSQGVPKDSGIAEIYFIFKIHSHPLFNSYEKDRINTIAAQVKNSLRQFPIELYMVEIEFKKQDQPYIYDVYQNRFLLSTKVFFYSNSQLFHLLRKAAFLHNTMKQFLTHRKPLPSKSIPFWFLDGMCNYYLRFRPSIFQVKPEQIQSQAQFPMTFYSFQYASYNPMNLLEFIAYQEQAYKFGETVFKKRELDDSLVKSLEELFNTDMTVKDLSHILEIPEQQILSSFSSIEEPQKIPKQ